MRRAYLLSFALLTAAVFWVAVAVHELRGVDLALLASAFRAHDRVVLFGNSINRTVSRCDADRRSLPELLAAAGATSVLDLSRGGMTLAQMLRIAEVTTAVGLKPAAFVFPVTFAELLLPASEAYGWRSFARDNRLPWVETAAERTAIPDPGAAPYKGRRYGSYGEFSMTHFEREKREGGCPDGPGVDRHFVEFIYWRNYLQPTDVLLGVEDTLRRAQALRKKGVAVAFWIPPVDVDDLGALHGPAAVASLRQRIGRLTQAFVTSGFPVFDTSNELPGAAFADRWCACGHLGETGRLQLAHRLAADLAALGLAP